MAKRNIISYLLPVPDDAFHKSSSSVALLGAKETCKTSLLFQAAINILDEDPEGIVVYFAPSQIEALPCPVHHMSKISASFSSRLVMKYMSSANELLNFLASYHTKRTYPRAFILDDMDKFMKKAHLELGMISASALVAKIVAILVDLSDFCTEKSNKRCLVLASSTIPKDFILGSIDPILEETPQDPPKQIEKHIPAIFGHFIEDVIKIDGTSIGNIKRFEMTTTDETLKVNFFLEDGQIFLDRLTCE